VNLLQGYEFLFIIIRDMSSAAGESPMNCSNWEIMYLPINWGGLVNEFLISLKNLSIPKNSPHEVEERLRIALNYFA